jgi:hypothetical protein
MGRTRQLKPCFFKDEDIARISAHARILFQGLWTIADKRGRLEDRPDFIKSEILPYENIDMENLFSELTAERQRSNGSFITRYSVDGIKYIQINSFQKHQNCHPKEPESTIPEPKPESRGKPRKAAKGREKTAPCRENIPLPSSPSSSSLPSSPSFPSIPSLPTGEEDICPTSVGPGVALWLRDGNNPDDPGRLHMDDDFKRHIAGELERYSAYLDEEEPPALGVKLSRTDYEKVKTEVNHLLMKDTRLRATEKSKASKHKQFRSLIVNKFKDKLIWKRSQKIGDGARASPSPAQPRSFDAIQRRRERRIADGK